MDSKIFNLSPYSSQFVPIEIYFGLLRSILKKIQKRKYKGKWKNSSITKINIMWNNKKIVQKYVFNN